MAPKSRKIIGLQRLHNEWINDCLVLESLPTDWAEDEARRFPEPWLNPNPSLHAFRRLAILADTGAVRLLLSISGEDWKKEQLIHAAADKDVVAARAVEAAQNALAYIAANPREATPVVARSPPPPSCDSMDDSSSE